MSPENRALCYYYRSPPQDSTQPRMKYTAIAKLVYSLDGKTHPTPSAVRKCVLGWRHERQRRGRKKGTRKTTKHEDKVINKCFHKARRPLGSKVTAGDVARRCPRALRRKVSLRTVRRRLAEVGYKPVKKIEKADFLRKQRLARVAFCQTHAHRSSAMWAAYLQGCADLKDFTYYPRKMKARFARYRCSWTYMKACERCLPQFVKPRKERMFGRKEYQTVRKGKVLGFTASTGRQLFVRCPQPWNTEAYARLIRQRVGPFFRRNFPGRASIRILIDGEPLLHTDLAKAAYAEFGMQVLPGWPKYSPDLNPQENVWSWVEQELRKGEKRSDTFDTFCKKMLTVSRRYPAGSALIPSMAQRLEAVLNAKGGMTKY